MLSQVHKIVLKGVIDMLGTFLKRHNFENWCAHWQNPETDDQLYGNVYDGKAWKSFERWNDQDFLALPQRFGSMLNIDFKHHKGVSDGVLYMELMNPPCSQRFKWEKVIIIGIIPALSKEPPSLKYFLNPLVDGLKLLGRGIKVKTCRSHTEGAEMCAALVYCAADIPATRKL